ncbi:MAG: hydroxyacid dehydrogenase [Provencibacterium sp.]|jgi:phosphoglycerate dehydrogenase-like enzyme|nr:hydroxyacid dehydrogenase [Provencibacterium sp.]
MKALVVPAKKSLEKVCSPACRELLDKSFEVIYNESEKELTSEELAVKIQDADILLTTWGSPVLTGEALEAAKNLKYIGHAAGTLKNRIPDETFDRGIRVFSGAGRIARSVAEYCMAAVFVSLRNFKSCDRDIRTGDWAGAKSNGTGDELTGNTVGIISASSTAREFLQMLAPFGCTIKLYDPFLSAEAAADLGAQKAELDEVMACPIVSNHAPVLPSTKGMITRRRLSLIPDGGLFINSARAVLVDNDALYDELQSGRIRAVLDVFNREPLEGAELERLRGMDNTVLTPHIAGATHQEWQALMNCIVTDILHAIHGEKTHYEIPASRWEILA